MNPLSATVFLLSISLSAQVTALKVGHLVNPETGSAAANQTILIENGKFTAVGRNVPIPTGATVVDLSQYYGRRAWSTRTIIWRSPIKKNRSITATT